MKTLLLYSNKEIPSKGSNYNGLTIRNQEEIVTVEREDGLTLSVGDWVYSYSYGSLHQIRRFKFKEIGVNRSDNYIVYCVTASQDLFHEKDINNINQVVDLEEDHILDIDYKYGNAKVKPDPSKKIKSLVELDQEVI